MERRTKAKMGRGIGVYCADFLITMNYERSTNKIKDRVSCVGWVGLLALSG